jgi:hypothetical protein
MVLLTVAAAAAPPYTTVASLLKQSKEEQRTAIHTGLPSLDACLQHRGLPRLVRQQNNKGRLLQLSGMAWLGVRVFPGYRCSSVTVAGASYSVTSCCPASWFQGGDHRAGRTQWSWEEPGEGWASGGQQQGSLNVLEPR